MTPSDSPTGPVHQDVNAELRDHRWAMIQDFGAETMDKAIGTFMCDSCGIQVPDPTLTTIAGVPYDDLDSFVEHAEQVATGRLEEPEAPSCPRCDQPCKLALIELHAYDAHLERDIVAQAIAPQGLLGRWHIDLLQWTPDEGFSALDAEAAEADGGFALSALIRRALTETMMEDPDADALVAAAEDALAAHGGHTLLLGLIPHLLSFGQAGICASIADHHIDAHPNDPRGHAWMGEILSLAVNHGALELDAIHDACEHLQRALALDPELLPAAVSLGVAYRIQGDPAAARATFEDLLDRHPEAAPAHYNLAVMDLDAEDYEAALAHFQAGAAADPDDADYPMGCIRALIPLGRYEEARTYLEQVRELAPDHPMLEQVAEALGG